MQVVGDRAGVQARARQLALEQALGRLVHLDEEPLVALHRAEEDARPGHRGRRRQVRKKRADDSRIEDRAGDDHAVDEVEGVDDEERRREVDMRVAPVADEQPEEGQRAVEPGGGVAGLPYVENERWGGLMLTLLDFGAQTISLRGSSRVAASWKPSPT